MGSENEPASPSPSTCVTTSHPGILSHLCSLASAATAPLASAVSFALSPQTWAAVFLPKR
eukprot:CAMPEP_0173466284 /NCGR_PEP_ID=MMETSP1357-20121228/73059_1 /TAXON_ID=77926 /ORGANISM="Hemiselmis rufescens, Strain PCC563" /LENGTH=59 /DNA_ID=CAMNT_0014434321 /DNA_START=145 /DNA_END=324 /DNA_ORIENTATION=-